jgi:hypothetical protein
MQRGSHEIQAPQQTVGGIHCLYRETLEAGSERVWAGILHGHGPEEAIYSERDDADVKVSGQGFGSPLYGG